MSLPRVYPLLGLGGAYLLVLLFNPVRLALRDGFRCVIRFKRVWLTFALLGFAYFVFQFAAFSPLQHASEFDLNQVADVRNWSWPRFEDVWQETPLLTLEGVAGIFDNATTTFPLSAVASIMLLLNWRGLHGALLRALQQRFGAWGYFVYLVLVLSALASLFKLIVFWRLPAWSTVLPQAGLLRVSAGVDAAAFIFEYLLGVYIQVYLITVCLAWVKGLSFTEPALFKFAMRRFSYVLKWAGLLVLVSTLLVRLPLLLAYFVDLPGVLDYQPLARYAMSALILLFCSVQISLVLHNESLHAAVRAHLHFIRQNALRCGWFLLICALQFFLLSGCDAIVGNAAADRAMAIIVWKLLSVLAHGLVTGWLLASWVCLFRQCESGRVNQETWIKF